MRVFYLSLSLLVFSITGCASTNPETIQSLDDFLTMQANLAHQEYKDKGLLVENPEVINYVRRLGKKLTPKGHTVRFYVLRDPVINAYAFPNGNVYITLGLLNRMESELQVAHVLAHEIIHVTNQHSLKQFNSARSKTITANVLDIVLVGAGAATGSTHHTGTISGLVHAGFASSMMSHSREHELESDTQALPLLSKQGYDLTKTPAMFEKLQTIKSAEANKASIWRTHPTNSVRKENTKKHIYSGAYPINQGGRVGHQPHTTIRQSILKDNLALRIAQGSYTLALEDIKRDLKKGLRPAMLHYYQGEIYRLMASDTAKAARDHSLIMKGKRPTKKELNNFASRKKEFYQNAHTAYDQAINNNYQYAFKGKGLTYADQGMSKKARYYLTQYLAAYPNAYDSRYIKSFMKE